MPAPSAPAPQFGLDLAVENLQELAVDFLDLPAGSLPVLGKLPFLLLLQPALDTLLQKITDFSAFSITFCLFYQLLSSLFFLSFPSFPVISNSLPPHDPQTISENPNRKMKKRE